MTFPRMSQGFQNPSEIIANTVIIEGSKAGLFLYSGTPGPGNPPIFSITTASVDPYGNAVAQNAVASDNLPILLYNPSAGAGNLITSLSPALADTTDSFGNTVKGGFFNGKLSVPGAGFVQITNGLITFGISSEIPSGLEAGITASGGITEMFSDLASVGDSATTLKLNSGANGGLLTHIAGRDGNTYQNGTLHLQSANAIQTISSTSPTGVTGLNCPVSPGRYRVHAIVNCQQGGAAFGQGLQLSGPTATLVAGDSIQMIDGSPPATWGKQHHGSFPANFTGPAHAALGQFSHEIECIVTFSAIGTLSVDAFIGTATHNFTILAAGGMLDVTPC